MPNQEKVKLVEQIKEDLQAADAVWVVDYRGLTVKQAEDLRGKIRAEGATYHIYKNTFTVRAMNELELPDLGNILEGPSGFVFVSGDPVASAKVLKAFAKEHQQLVIKGGLFEGKVLADSEVIAVADLPSREELIGHVLALLDSPLQQTLAALDTSTVIYGLLDAIEEKAA